MYLVSCSVNSIQTISLVVHTLDRLFYGIPVQNPCLCWRHHYLQVAIPILSTRSRWWVLKTLTIWSLLVQMVSSAHGNWICWLNPKITWNYFTLLTIRRMKSPSLAWASLIMKLQLSGQVLKKEMYIKLIDMIALEGIVTKDNIVIYKSTKWNQTIVKRVLTNTIPTVVIMVW